MIIAKLNYLRISPRKIRLVAGLIKGLDVRQAESQLKFLTKRGAEPMLKLLKSAIANAEHNANLIKENLYVVNVIVNPGPSLKRWRSRAMGRVLPIMKRTSHIVLVLDQKTETSSTKKIHKSEKDKDIDKEKIQRVEGISNPIEKIENIQEEGKQISRPKQALPLKPYQTTPQSKKRFFSRQTFKNAKKLFRRKSI